MKGLNAEQVLVNLEKLLETPRSVQTRSVCNELEIFDWWNEYLPVYKQKQMRSFLKLAIKLGYTGYVCFKVGASGCANGMWAHKAESEDGYSPKGECLYRSFTPDYTYYSFQEADGTWYPKAERYDFLHTASRLKEALRLRAMGKEI